MLQAFSSKTYPFQPYKQKKTDRKDCTTEDMPDANTAGRGEAGFQPQRRKDAEVTQRPLVLVLCVTSASLRLCGEGLKRELQTQLQLPPAILSRNSTESARR